MKYNNIKIWKNLDSHFKSQPREVQLFKGILTKYFNHLLQKFKTQNEKQQYSMPIEILA